MATAEGNRKKNSAVIFIILWMFLHPYLNMVCFDKIFESDDKKKSMQKTCMLFSGITCTICRLI